MEQQPNVPPTVGNVQFPAHPEVHQQSGDHYKVLQHAMGLLDLNATEEGRAVLWRYNADADLARGSVKDARVIEAGELPPSHLTDEERVEWLECQRTGEPWIASMPSGSKRGGGK